MSDIMDPVLKKILARGRCYILTVKCGGDRFQDYCNMNNGVSFMGLILLEHPDDDKLPPEVIWAAGCFPDRELALRSMRFKASEKGLTIVRENATDDKLKFETLAELFGQQWRGAMGADPAATEIKNNG